MKLPRVVLLVLVICLLAIAINRAKIADHNIDATHFDTLIVLGYPANPDGTPSPEQRERVLEAVREYRSGVAPNIIVTGGPAHNRFVEADVMAALAATQGVPLAAIVEEPQAQNTIQNIFFSSEIMHARNWHSAEIVSSPAHLGRAAMILSAFDSSQARTAIEWRTHPSLWPTEYSVFHRALLDSFEATRCLQIRIFGLPTSRFLPHR